MPATLCAPCYGAQRTNESSFLPIYIYMCLLSIPDLSLSQNRETNDSSWQLFLTKWTDKIKGPPEPRGKIPTK